MSTLRLSPGYAAQKLPERQREREGLKPNPSRPADQRSPSDPPHPPCSHRAMSSPNATKPTAPSLLHNVSLHLRVTVLPVPLAVFTRCFSLRRISAATVPLGISSDVGFLRRLFINPAPPHCQFSGVGEYPSCRDSGAAAPLSILSITQAVSQSRSLCKEPVLKLAHRRNIDYMLSTPAAGISRCASMTPGIVLNINITM